MTFGSNELIYVAGSNLPIMIEQLEEEECEKEIDTPLVPPRAPKVARTRTPEPKISFSYTHDPRVTPTRKTSTLSHASLTVQYNDMPLSQDIPADQSPPRTLPRKRAKKTTERNAEDIEHAFETKPAATPRNRSKKRDGYESIKENSYSTLEVHGSGFELETPETLPRKSKQTSEKRTSKPASVGVVLEHSGSVTSDTTEATDTTVLKCVAPQDITDIESSLEEFDLNLVTPPPRKYATIPKKKAAKQQNLRALTPEVEERIQSRPLPPPPAPPRTLKKKSASIEESEGRTSRSSETSYRDVHEATYTETENFRTCAETLNTSKTMKGSSSQSGVEDDVTLADSVVDSLVSCAETLVGDNDNLETCADTLTGGDLDQGEFYSDDDIDNPYPSVDFNQMMDQGPGAGAKIVEEERSGRSMVKKSEAKKGEVEVKKSESGRRLEEGTQQLSIELMEHVESLKTTLDNMSSRLGTRSRSRSQSKSRPASTFKDQM